MAVAWFRNPVLDVDAPMVERHSVNERMFGVTVARRHPAYVHGVNKNSALMHKVERVEIQHYAIVNMDMLGRLKQPAMIARTVCGYNFLLTPERARTCTIPRPESVLCGRCHGEPSTFAGRAKQTRNGVPRAVAQVQLGCEVAGYPSSLTLPRGDDPR